MILTFLNSYLPSQKDQQSAEFLIFTWVFIIAVLIFLVLVILYYIGEYLKQNNEREIKLQKWSLGIFGGLTLIVLLLHAFINKQEAPKELINLIVIPIIVGIISSLFSPLVQILFEHGYVKDSVMPGVPLKIYKAAKKPGKYLQTDLEKQLKETKSYKYSGIDMKIATESLYNVLTQGNAVELNEIHFIIPTREALEKAKICSKTDDICNSLDMIRNAFRPKSGLSIKIDFILLDYVPSHHMHLTDKKCWFASVDKNYKISYPTTYLYGNISNKNAMYKTLCGMIDTQIRRFTPSPNDSDDLEENKRNDLLKDNYFTINIGNDDRGYHDLSQIDTIKEKYSKSQCKSL